jgi:hypothetical protein
MHIINLLLQGEVYVCEICGFLSSEKHRIIRHENGMADLEGPSVQVGDKVQIYTRVWGKDGVSSARSEQPEEWMVQSLWYSKGDGHFHEHQLLVGLKKEIGICGKSFFMIPHKEFLLWREGDEKKLIEAGLINPAVIESLNFFQRMLRAFAVAK